jgi:hypothetical protein
LGDNNPIKNKNKKAEETKNENNSKNGNTREKDPDIPVTFRLIDFNRKGGGELYSDPQSRRARIITIQ